MKRGFKTKRDAERFVNAVEASKMTGSGWPRVTSRVSASVASGWDPFAVLPAYCRLGFGVDSTVRKARSVGV